MIPPMLFLFWLIGVLSLAIWGLSGWLIWEWYDNWVRDLPANPRFLIGGVLLLCVALFGQPMITLFLGRKARPGEEEPGPLTGGSVQRVTRPDGTTLHVEIHGSADAPVLLFTHGWSLSSAEWFYAKQHLANRYQLVVWDLPGLGHSREAHHHNRDLANFAGDLEAVLSLVEDRQVILCGHSIGGMITLTFCRLFPERLVRQVVGLVLTHTSYTNPVNTSWGARVSRPLQGPVLRPMCYLTIALSPVMSVMNRLSGLNGTAHILSHFLQFGGQETRGQLRFLTALGLHANPAVVSRGMLAMMDYQAANVVPNLAVPVLVVAASADKMTLPVASRWIAVNAPQAQEVVLAPAGHLGLIEQHEVWAKAVDHFAQTCFEERP